MVLIFVLGILSASSFAGTGEIKTYRVVDEDCEIFLLKNQRWEKQKTTLEAIPENTVIKARSLTKSLGYVTFYFRMEIAAVPVKCLEVIPPEKLQSVDPQEEVQKITKKTEDSVASSSQDRSPLAKWYLSFGVYSWQDNPSLHGPDDQVYELRSKSAAGGSGFGRRFQSWGPFQLDLGGTFLIGKAEVGELGTNAISTSLRYRATNINVWALKLAPGILWHPETSSVGAGLEVPFLYQRTSFEKPGDGFRVAGESSLLVGLSFKARLERESLSVIPQFGFLERWHSLFWAFEISISL